MTYETLVRRVMEVEANEDIKKPSGEEPRPCNICEVRDSESVLYYYDLVVQTIHASMEDCYPNPV